MFWFDKDMERVMLAKKKEVLHDIEVAKKRVLEELYCLKRSVHTDLCGLQADYNRMSLTLTQTVNEIRAELKCITDEYRNLIANTFNQYTTTIENKLLALETFEKEVIKEVNDKLSELEDMKAQVEALIAEVSQIVEDGVTEADLQALKDELMSAMENAGKQADWNENDETSAAFVKNRTHYGEVTESVAWEKKWGDNYSQTGKTELSNIDNSTWPVLTSCWYDLNFNIPDNCTAINVITSAQGRDDVVFTLNRRDGSFVFHEPSTQLVENAVVYGEPYNGEIAFDEANKTDNYIIAFNPNIGLWRLYCRNAISQYIGVKIMTVSGGVTKELAPEYLAKGGSVGTILVNAGDHSEWRKMPGTTVNVLELAEVFNEHLDYVDTTSNHNFKYNGAITPSELIERFGEKDSVNFVKYTCGDKTVTAKIGTKKLSSSEWRVAPLNANTFSNKIYSSVSTGLFTTEQVQNGIDIAIWKYKSYVRKEPFAPSDIAETPAENAVLTVRNGKAVWATDTVLTSPNGTKYTLTVSNDGTLSATPVTE